MDEFWKAWASVEARQQWFIYSDRASKVTPDVETVEADGGRFLVTFANGDVLEVVPSGIARPVHLVARDH